MVANYTGNITAAGARRRRIGGVISLGLAIVLYAVLVFANAPRLARLMLFVPLAFAALGFFQASEKTCVALSAVGKREVEGAGTCALRDDERGAVSARARRVMSESLLVAAVVTAILCAAA